MGDGDPVPLLLASAVASLIGRDAAAAERRLREIDAGALFAARKAAMDAVWGPGVRNKYPPVRTVPVRRRNVPSRVVADTFRRDHFTCRYCGRRTVHLDVLKLLSRALPDVLPYDAGWKPVEKLIVFWTHSASVEHHVPLARGGSDDPRNIVTACYQCNDVKNYYLAEELGWTLRPVEPSDWDGLTSSIAPLRRAVAATAARPPEGFISGPPSSERERPERATTPDGRTQPPTQAPVATASPTRLAIGALVRLALPGKGSRRSYRIEAFEGRTAVLREMWRAGPERRWVQSGARIRVALDEQPNVDVVASTAPEPGTSDTT